jgi:hypothetical protein
MREVRRKPFIRCGRVRARDRAPGKKGTSIDAGPPPIARA